MSLHRPWPLRFSLTVLMIVSTVITFSLVVAGLLVVRQPQLARDAASALTRSAGASAERVEDYLRTIETRLVVAGAALAEPPVDPSPVLAAVISNDLSAFYMLDRDGYIVAARTNGTDPRFGQALIGTDQSYNALVREALTTHEIHWSDKFLSAFTGQVGVGVALPFGDHLLVGELSLETVLATLRSMTGGAEVDTMVIDRHGEVIADTAREDDLPTPTNWHDLPLAAATRPADAGPMKVEMGGHDYYVGTRHSEELGWTFVARAPAGIKHPGFRALLETVAWGLGSALLMALLLAPLWARHMARPVQDITARVSLLAAGKIPTDWPTSAIAEYVALAEGMAFTGRALQARQSELHDLNEKLEARVSDRTAELSEANQRLSAAAERLRHTQASLVQSEKLAALGGLVAGIAHELNTPIGNGLMAATTLCEVSEDFSVKSQAGLTRTDLRHYVEDVEGAVGIITRNLNRAADLVASFKQVAVDQTSTQRREFTLDEVLDEILLTLQPSLKRTEVEVVSQVPDSLRMDSFPGPLGQVLTNLVMNATIHAFDDGHRAGTIRISARRVHGLKLEVEVADDGAGIEPAVISRIFDPFYTTRQGHGGTGLGLHIVHNAVTNVLGGRIAVTSQPGNGTCFTLHLPMIAPERRGAEA